jgi:hypothetical protein
MLYEFMSSEHAISLNRFPISLFKFSASVLESLVLGLFRIFFHPTRKCYWTIGYEIIVGVIAKIRSITLYNNIAATTYLINICAAFENLSTEKQKRGF